MMKKAKKKARTATARTDFRISLLRDEQMPDRPCAPGDVMIELANSGKLPNFQREFGAPRPDGLGDCHDVTLALMVDLIAAERADGWSWVQGSIVTGHGERFDHSWLEHDGWAVDVANGKVLVMRSSRYDEMTKAEQKTVRDAVQTSAWMTSSNRKG